MVEGLKTTLTKAHSKSESLRTTIPMCIRKQFDLEKGDKLLWNYETKDDQLILVVKPDKKKNQS